ncbi:MAG: glycosyltransferase family 2 protein [Lachnospiraceae bacterium]|nr:glycosyltransferase family 2 protein [Lachnospiraceae bacterium]
MSEKLISIIIPHYNIPYMLEKLLESTPYDREDVEVIVVDDRSDKDLDRLIGVRDRFGSAGVLFYRNNNGKKGAGTCRNIGLRHASGKWLIFADADDRFKTGMYEAVKKFADTEADIVYYMSESINEDGDRVDGRSDGYNLKISNFLNDPGRRNELLLRYDMPTPWGKMIRARKVKENRIWFDEIPVSNDVMFSAKCGCHSDTVIASRDCLYQVLERRGSLTTTPDPEAFNFRTGVFIRMCKYLKNRLTDEDWKMLGFNGNIRIIEAYQKGYGLKCIGYIIFGLLFNGIKPVSFKGMSIKTAGGTLKNILEGRAGGNAR